MKPAQLPKAILLFPLVLLFVIPMAGQADHATATKEQCRADATVWGIPNLPPGLAPSAHYYNWLQLENNLVTETAGSDVSSKLLDARIVELMQCQEIDSGVFGEKERYQTAVQAYKSAELIRIVDFIKRHDLMEQFYKDDGEGQR